MNKQIPCIDCKKIFVFTDKEQVLFTSRHFPDPIRCKKCRKAIKTRLLAHRVEAAEIKP